MFYLLDPFRPPLPTIAQQDASISTSKKGDNSGAAASTTEKRSWRSRLYNDSDADTGE